MFSVINRMVQICYDFRQNNKIDIVRLPNDEVGGEARKKKELAEDLEDLINTLAGFLPYSYLTDKLLKYTKGWKDVYKIIMDDYNVQVSSETLFDFESIHKNSEETHSQFFERLLQHTKQHLAPADTKLKTLLTLSRTVNLTRTFFQCLSRPNGLT